MPSFIAVRTWFFVMSSENNTNQRQKPVLRRSRSRRCEAADSSNNLPSSASSPRRLHFLADDCSADFQSAVSQNFILRHRPATGTGLLDALPIANRRYGRLQICATPARPGAFVLSPHASNGISGPESGRGTGLGQARDPVVAQVLGWISDKRRAAWFAKCFDP